MGANVRSVANFGGGSAELQMALVASIALSRMEETTMTQDFGTARPMSSLHHEPLSDGFQKRLARFNLGRLRARCPAEDWEDEHEKEFVTRRLEAQYIEAERAEVEPLLADVPTDADAFVTWFESLKAWGPGQGDPLFPWLAQSAGMASMRWFLTQEVGGEAGFDDLVAMTQIQLPAAAKLELARNYWDEMGRGRQEGMHGLLLDATVDELQLKPSLEGTVWESLALANLMLGLARQRRYVYLSVGALGVVELTAPGRVAQVNEGLRRLGVSATGRRYFQLHAGLDIRHSESWNREAIHPLVKEFPECARHIAAGALLRLRSGQRCFERYRRHLGLNVIRHVA